MISFVRNNNYKSIELTRQGQNQWHGLCDVIFHSIVLAAGATRINSWAVGANIPGKPTSLLYFFGGLPAYSAQIANEAKAGYSNYRFA
jgi:hypothetical protein